MTITRHDIIQSLIQLGNILRNEPPKMLVRAAIEANPWFTSFYIRQSLASIASWLSPASLQRHVATYPVNKDRPKHIGIIAAGNVPLVGFHDLLIALLSGHIAYVKCSHQDEVLMHWLVDEWGKLLPQIKAYVHFVQHIDSVDYLIATGSNNTARYLHANFNQTKTLIRKNRFSVAILDKNLTVEELYALSDDIFLHNGLGCRNVNNFLVLADFDLERWKFILYNYPLDRLNPSYLKKVSHERARLKIQGDIFIDTPSVLLQFSETFAFGKMGIITLIEVASQQEAQALIDSHLPHIQCIAGVDVAMGMCQYPDLFTFSDKVNTMELLMAC